jgi:hypothetical protein
MITIDLVLRIIAASLELTVEATKKATPEQVQAIIERHNQRMDFYERLLNKLNPFD